MKKIILTACLILLATAFESVAQFTAELYSGDITVQLSAEPEQVDPVQDLMLTLNISYPASLKIELPDLQDRFQGFSMAEDFSAEPIEAAGRVLLTQKWKLTPRPAAERYRLAPFALIIHEQSDESPRTYSIATKPVVFPAPAQRPPVTGEPEVSLQPEWIAPTPGTILLWIVIGIAAIAIIALILYALTKISNKVKEYRMSPIERAMTELERLLKRKLPQKGLFKDFYVELTMVVRRYIERSHNVRAPEQTTEEFLAAAAAHPDFTAENLKYLKTFLESADLVKFAGQQADLSMTEDAISRAREYLNSDARSTDKTTSNNP